MTETKLPYMIQQSGVLNLNGPHITGFGAMTRVFVGPGVGAGCDVMVLATTPEVAAGIAHLAPFAIGEHDLERHAARADEEIGMRHALRLKRVAERLDDMLLPDELVEAAGTPAARDDLEAGCRHWRLGKVGPKGCQRGKPRLIPIRWSPAASTTRRRPRD